MSLSADHPTEMSTILKKSREGLYFNPDSQANLLQLWEDLRFQSFIEGRPEIQPTTYDFEQILGVEYDGSHMTRETCGLAIVDDQLEKGIEAVTEIAGAIQRKERHIRKWVVAYDLYRTKFNAEQTMKATLGNPYKNAWDSWPERVWIVLSYFKLTYKRRSSKGRKEFSNASGAMLGP